MWPFWLPVFNFLKLRPNDEKYEVFQRKLKMPNFDEIGVPNGRKSLIFNFSRSKPCKVTLLQFGTSADQCSRVWTSPFENRFSK